MINKEKTEPIMRQIKIEKIVLSVGGIGEHLEKGFKIIEILTGKKPAKMRTKKEFLP